MNYCDIIEDIKTIAVVGISKDEYKTSRVVAKFLIGKGFNVVGVNPATPDISGIKVYANLKNIPHPIDLVDVFMRSEKISLIIQDVIEIRPKYLWLQLGIENNEVVAAAKDANINTVQNKCIKIEYNNCYN